MKCPEWLLEAMRKGEGVKCWVWDCDVKRPDICRIENVIGFNVEGDLFFYAEDADEWFEHAEPYTEPAHEFKPFEQVLIRDDNCDAWTAGYYSYFDKDPDFSNYPHVTCGSAHWSQCIPYAGNEHLLGTTNSPKN
jgi:hypothetical protein